jgi:hypothetical protein
MDLYFTIPVRDTLQKQADISFNREILLTDHSTGFQIDSSRLTINKPVIPVVKSIPIVPYSDTTPHPVYDPITDVFYINSGYSTISELYVNPIEPLEVNPQKIQHKKAVRIIQTQVIPEKSISRKQTLEKTDIGFESTDWMFAIIVVLLILFAWIRVGFGRFVNTVVQASYNFFTARRIFEEANVVRSRIFIFFNLLFFINISLFTSQSIDFFNINPSGFKGFSLFGICFAMFFLIYMFKSFILWLLDFLFLTQGGFSSYNFTIFLYNKVYGLLLIPIVSVLPFVSIYFAQIIIYIGIGLFGLFYIFRIFRGFQLALKNRLSIFYLFLYLCALEILPLLVLYKLVMMYK